MWSIEVLMSSTKVLMSSIGVNELNRGVNHLVARQGCNLLRAAVTSAVTSQGCCCGNLQIHPLDLGHSPPGTVSSLRLSSEGRGVECAW